MFWTTALLVCLAGVGVVAGISGHDQAQVSPGGNVGLKPAQSSAGPAIKTDMNYGRMPLYFIPNQGQMDERVLYYIQGRDKSIYFGAGEVTFSLMKFSDKAKDKKLFGSAPFRRIKAEGKPAERWTVRLEFVGADEKVKPVAEDKTGAVISYFKGRQENWKTGLPTYSRIVYRTLWPGIDLAYSGTENQLKYEFFVHPGADPAAIRLRYRGAEKVAVNGEGRLEVTTPIASFLDDKPAAWQDIGGVRKDVGMSYSLAAEPKTTEGERTRDLGFKIGAYDPTLTLVLDPSYIAYCGYIGGDYTDGGYGIAVDTNKNVYITGSTASSVATFPVRVGPDLTTNGALDNEDAFVAKVNAAGTGIIYCGYIGGAGLDIGYAIAVNSIGNAYVVGTTDSDQTSFPVRVGPDLTFNGSGGALVGGDGFVAKVSASGANLLYCGYIGGSGDDWARGVAVDSLGRAYICGETQSSEYTFPVLSGPDLTYNGGQDAFIAKVNAAGSGLSYCGYIGGEYYEGATAIALDSSSNAYITGYTDSDAATFPVRVGPDLTLNGNSDAFVAEVNSSGTALVFCGYIGGAGSEYAFGIARDHAGFVYIAGNTTSDELSFPVSIGPDLTYNGGLYDSFIAKVYASGMGLDYCGYIGGSGTEYVGGIAVDSKDYAYVAGKTFSDQTTFPVRGGPGLVYKGMGDAYIARVAPTGRSLSYCGYVGGADIDDGMGIAVDARQNAYLIGETSSPETSFPVLTGPDLTWNYYEDAFVAKISLIPELTLNIPIGYERWVVGLTKKIEWATEDQAGKNRIEYSTDKGLTWSVIALGTPDDGSYSWVVPNKPSEACLIRITQKESGQYDQSDQPFAIIPKPKITIVSPNGGEIWTGYDQRAIQWTSAGTVGDVKIEYSKDGGAHWFVVIASTPNTGSYIWVVPNTPSNNCLVRIMEAADGSPMDKSNVVFKIKPAGD